MEACAAKVGLNWTALHACGTGPMGNATNEAAVYHLFSLDSET